MADRRPFQLRSLRYLRDVPLDLTVVIAVTILVNLAVFAPVVRETSARVPLALVFLLFVPGYALVAALFPEAEPSPVGNATAGTELESEENERAWTLGRARGIDVPARIALSLCLSVAIVPLIGLVLTVSSLELRLLSLTAALSVFVILVTAISVVRRWRLPENERFHVPYRKWVATARATIVDPGSRADTVLSILLIVSIVVAFGSVAVAVTHTSQGESFSELYLVTEDEDGELVADGYPTTFEDGESQEVVLGVENNEHRTANYTAVVVEQTVDTESNETIVQDQRELDRSETQLAHDDTWLYEHELEPTITGEQVRIVWLLYVDGDVPSSPSIENADNHVHLWVTVDDGDS